MARYSFSGTCCREIDLTVEEGRVKKIDFIGGCPGSLLGIKQLIEGEEISSIINKMEGLPCGNRSTSCPDQLSKVLKSINR